MKPSQLRPGLTTSLHTRLALTQGVLTGMSVLRLSTADLIDAIEREAADNPFLLIDNLRSQAMPLSRVAYDIAMETIAAPRSLVEDLRHQIAAMTLPEPVRALAEYLAGDLREDGYLDTSLEEIRETLGLPMPLIESALKVVQSCDPAGVGARTLGECLELQLIDRGVDITLARRMIAHLELFAAEDWSNLIRKMRVSQAELQRLAALIQGLNPHPVNPTEAPGVFLSPDLILEPDRANGYSVQLGTAIAPHVHLNADLIAASAVAGGGFGTDRRLRAEAMMAALRFRGDTLLRIGRHIAQVQHRFFALGPDHHVPLSRTRLAAELGLHPSTIGRAVAGKAIELGGQLFALSVFFSTSLPGADNKLVSAFVVQRSIARLIEHEPRSEPLSDEAICQALRATGVDISRRTVAKYRGCMRIPSSFARRRRKAVHRACLAKPDSRGTSDQ